ncbi:DNA polymerase-3 subunit delta' [Lachnotalea glycerini]|uniref:DNA polymerase III subunit delta' n=1 Tax=Lachnotalea glycerini TaxID=1763509 RepID=A0A255IID2_9FIRM|nr:DNA polymerase III subunit delta' [Lachnotalea glycerini]PXV84882.1 DNA polymerase-3 subunit delta' [Lachnotalea glycerini]RDY29087.1 DNA polymerase III subunit delta' [Lachnotalea glycerini]
MSGFKNIIGHKQVIEHLRSAIKLDKVSHAYILNGEEGSGKKMLASAFAMTLQCETGNDEPCGKCKSCIQAMNNNHPDIIWVTHEKPGSIGVDDIRVQLNNDIGIKPYSSNYKIYIINEADKLTLQAQNALLKTLEEPPAYAVIVLLTVNHEALLQTILSRCITLNLRFVEDDLIKRYLMEVKQVPDYKANISVAFAQGNVGKAINLASTEDFDQLKDDTFSMLRNMNDMEMYEVIEYIKKIAENKLNIEDYLDLITMWFRDVLLFKATNDVNSLVFKDSISDIKKQANERSYNGIENIIDAIDKAKVRLKANVNFELVMELLLLTMKEN